jgi:hypothetical protein
MTSTWSNLGLNLQGTGDNSGTWGQLTNVNLQDIDTAISGVAPITLTGNTTLAFTSNSSSTTFTNYPGLNKIIVLSGSLSATTVTVTVPNIQKDYVIVNNSGATVVVSSGGSTTISIPTSTNAYIYSNGSSSIFFALPLPIATNAGGTTNQVQYNNAGAFAGSTNLTFNGTTLAMQTATVLNLTSTTENITTANVTTANITSLTAVNTTTTSLAFTTASGTTATISGINATTLNINSGGIIKIYNTATSQYTGLQVAAGAATSQIFTLPSADGTSGQFLKTNGSGVLSFVASGAITWQSVQTTNFNAVAGNAYPVNTNTTAITATLSSSANVGDTIQFLDYLGTFATKRLTINPNGLKISGSTAVIYSENNNEGFQITYIDSTQGWLPTLAIYESNSVFSSTILINSLSVAGGGAGGYNNGAGGGAGGTIALSTGYAPGTTLTITIGAGGSGNTSHSPSPTGNTTTLTPYNNCIGGGGAGYSYGPGTSPGTPGGSGGGSTNGSGGAGTQGQGYPAGAGGTGGGASQPGDSGGSGISWPYISTTIASGQGVGQVISGTYPGTGSVYFGGGGGASGYGGGGGSGGNGSAYSGGGGGPGAGNPNSNGTNGGSGVVILSVPTENYSGTSTGSPTITTYGTTTLLTFKSSGSYTV